MRIFGRELSSRTISRRFVSTPLLAALAGVVVIIAGAEFNRHTRAGTMSEKDRIAAIERSINDPAFFPSRKLSPSEADVLRDVPRDRSHSGCQCDGHQRAVHDLPWRF